MNKLILWNQTYAYTHAHTARDSERERNTLSYDRAYIQILSNSMTHKHTYTHTYAPRTVTLHNACDDTNLSGRDAQASAHRSDGGVGRCDVGESAEIKINHCKMVKEKVER